MNPAEPSSPNPKKRRRLNKELEPAGAARAPSLASLRMESAELETLIIDAADNGVVTITMNRPHRLNAASPTMFTELRETWNEIGGDPTVRCVVMTGAGDAFCSGADLATDDDGPKRHPLQGLNVIHQTVSALYSIMVPVIAKVNGWPQAPA